jgi:hypothetical protein
LSRRGSAASQQIAVMQLDLCRRDLSVMFWVKDTAVRNVVAGSKSLSGKLPAESYEN